VYISLGCCVMLGCKMLLQWYRNSIGHINIIAASHYRQTHDKEVHQKWTWMMDMIRGYLRCVHFNHRTRHYAALKLSQ